MYSELTTQQSRVFIDSLQGYQSWLDARAKMRDYKGGMHWKSINNQQYLYRTYDSKGTAKSLGPRSDKTETIYNQFHQRRTELEHRVNSLTTKVVEQQRMARALRVGSAPAVLAKVCRALCEHDLMGKNVLIIGTNALYAYESLAGVRVQSDVMATQDMDVLFKPKSKLTAVAKGIGPEGFLGVLKSVDKTFEINEAQPFRATSSNGYMVDLIRQMPNPPWNSEPHNLGESDPFIAADLRNMEWMLSMPSMRQFVIADNGTPFEMEVPDPRAFMLFKSWLSEQPDREPFKRSRDAAQAHVMAGLLRDRLPQFPLDWSALRSFPKALIDRLENTADPAEDSLSP